MRGKTSTEIAQKVESELGGERPLFKDLQVRTKDVNKANLERQETITDIPESMANKIGPHPSTITLNGSGKSRKFCRCSPIKAPTIDDNATNDCTVTAYPLDKKGRLGNSRTLT